MPVYKVTVRAAPQQHYTMNIRAKDTTHLENRGAEIWRMAERQGFKRYEEEPAPEVVVDGTSKVAPDAEVVNHTLVYLDPYEKATRIRKVLEDLSSLCLDNEDEREKLIDALVNNV